MNTLNTANNSKGFRATLRAELMPRLSEVESILDMSFEECKALTEQEAFKAGQILDLFIDAEGFGVDRITLKFWYQKDMLIKQKAYALDADEYQLFQIKRKTTQAQQSINAITSRSYRVVDSFDNAPHIPLYNAIRKLNARQNIANSF